VILIALYVVLALVASPSTGFLVTFLWIIPTLKTRFMMPRIFDTVDLVVSNAPTNRISTPGPTDFFPADNQSLHYITRRTLVPQEWSESHAPHIVP
jgi:hypothetical protein